MPKFSFYAYLRKHLKNLFIAGRVVAERVQFGRHRVVQSYEAAAWQKCYWRSGGHGGGGTVPHTLEELAV